MKHAILLCMLVFSFANSGNSWNQNTSQSSLKEERLHDISYGDDPQQKMDLYLPANRVAGKTKVFILIHGGGWHSGDKGDMGKQFELLHTAFPNYAIVIANYRLATKESLGFPKQINDLQKLVSTLNSKTAEFNIGKQYAMVGVSAGAHLALLYGYKYNSKNQVKAICSIVGPADFSDPGYIGNPLFTDGINFLVGNYKSYKENPKLYDAVSPIKQITRAAPKTLLFYGGLDPLVPASQSKRLKQKLDSRHIINERYLYDSAGHGNWNGKQADEVDNKTIAFFRKYF